MAEIKLKDPTREYYHEVLDCALDCTKEGKSFLPAFVDMIMSESYNRSWNYLNKMQEDRYNILKGEC